MKNKEKEIVEILNRKTKETILQSPYEYCRYDAYNSRSIFEIKDRHKFYKQTIIEFDKFSYNITYAKIMNKRFYYAVRMEGVVYLFDIKELHKNKYDFKWEWRAMPKQTEFKENEDIIKFVGYININDCIRRYKG